MLEDNAKALAGVSRETRGRLNDYIALLLRWNRTINLIAAGDERRIWTRHVADSLQLAEHLPADCNGAIDLGSGAGFPGLVLAIATGIHFTLIEADQRRAAFLLEAIRISRASATVLAARVGTVAVTRTRLVTARSFAPLGRLLELASPILLNTGRLALLKGAHVDDEIAAARQAWDFDLIRTQSRTAGKSSVLLVERPTRRTFDGDVPCGGRQDTLGRPTSHS